MTSSRSGAGRRLALATAVAIATAAPVAAQDAVCAYQPAIIALTDAVLDKREDLSGFSARNFGAEAAYLSLRYAPRAAADARALIAGLIDRRVRFADDLGFAWAYATGGRDAVTELLGEGAVTEKLTASSVSALRALILGGEEQAVIDAIAGMAPGDAFGPIRAFATATLDLDDERKAALADAALAADVPYLAAALVATQSKAKAWTAFAKTLADPELIDGVTGVWRWLPAVVGNPELPLGPGMTAPADPAQRARIHDIMIVAAKSPQIEFLNVLLNQTGQIDWVAGAADHLAAAIDSGEVAVDGALGPAWLVAYRHLRETVANPSRLEQDLRSFRLNAGMTGSAEPMAIIDALIAAEALASYVSGEAAGPPSPPADLSQDFRAQWARWVDVATSLRVNPRDAALAVDDTLPIAAELLIAARDTESLAALIAAAPATSDVLGVASEAARRLDRLCESYLWHPAEAVLLPGIPVYKFAPSGA